VPNKFITCFTIFLVAGCSSPSPTPKSTLPKVEIPVVTAAAERSAENWLAEAAEAATPAQRQYALLLAAATWQDQGQWQASAAVLSQIKVAELDARDWRQYRLLQAQFAGHQQQWDEVLELLDNLVNQFTERSERAQALKLRSQAAAAKGDYLQAALWRIEQQRYQPESISDGDIWTFLKQVSPRAWNDYTRPADTESQGWTRLVQRLHDALNQQQSVAKVLEEWRQSFPNHPANAIINAEFADQLEPTQAERQIAFLLPLSGPYESQGKSIRDGAIGALLKSPALQATFIDTHQFASDAILEQLQVLQPEIVVGPLLKPQVEAFIQATASVVPDGTANKPSWTQLYLNEKPTLMAADSKTSDADAKLSPAYYFALDPETEVRTAADLLFQQNFQRPLVLAPDTERGKNLAQTFINHWQALPVANPDVAAGFYRTTEDMKSTVQLNLGIRDSDARINYVKIAAGKIIVDAEPRSRTDVDVIYLTGSAEQTKLLKPFIDVNTAPFAKRIPVYANSTSHVRQGRMSENDLHQVNFSESPWLLPDHAEYQDLERWLQLRDSWGYSHARLHAMGHDAVLLAPQLPLMQKLPGYRHSGRSGALSVRGDRVIRLLEWARFNQHQVQPMKGIDYVPSPSWSGR